MEFDQLKPFLQRHQHVTVTSTTTWGKNFIKLQYGWPKGGCLCYSYQYVVILAAVSQLYKSTFTVQFGSNN